MGKSALKIACVGGSNLSDKCDPGCNEVQDEKHLLFLCRSAEVCELRTRYKDLFADMFSRCMHLPRHQTLPLSWPVFIASQV